METEREKNIRLLKEVTRAVFSAIILCGKASKPCAGNPVLDSISEADALLKELDADRIIGEIVEVPAPIKEPGPKKIIT